MNKLFLLSLFLLTSLTYGQAPRNTRTDTMSPAAQGATSITVNATDFDVNGNVTVQNNLTLDTMTLGAVPFFGTAGLVSQDVGEFFFNDTLKYLGVGTALPTSRLSVTGTDELTSKVDVQAFSDVATVYPSVFLRRARSTELGPSAAQVGDELGRFQIQAYNGAAFIDGVSVRGISTDTWAALTGGAKMELSVNPDGALVQEVALTLEQDKQATFTGNIEAPEINITSVTDGSTPCPAMTEVQRDAITDLASGKCVFNLTTSASNIYNGAVWEELGTTGPVNADHPLWAVATAYVAGDILVDSPTHKLYRASLAHVSDAADIQVDIISGALVELSKGEEKIAFNVTQAGHGRAIGCPLTPVYYGVGFWTNARADSDLTLATHVIVEVLDGNQFIVAQVGKFDCAAHGLTADTHYYTSSTVSGDLTAVAPAVFVNPVLLADSANSVHITNYRASEKTLGGPSLVSSVFGRNAAVVSANGDYTASQVTNVPAGSVTAVTVQAAIDELEGLISGGSVTSVYGRGGAVVAAAGDYTASEVTNVAAGSIAAITTQAAIDELDTEKEPVITGGATTIASANLTASRALESNGSGKVIVSAVTSTELGYVSGVTSAIQTQIDNISVFPEFTLFGGLSSVGGSVTKAATYGHTAANGGFTMLRNGEITGISIRLNNARTAGTCIAAALINGVVQNGAGETVTIDGTNTQGHYQVIATPITYVAGDTLSLQTTTASFTPTGADPVITIWVRDR